MTDAIQQAIEALRMTKYCIPAYGFHAEKVTIDEAIAGLQALQSGEPDTKTHINLGEEVVELPEIYQQYGTWPEDIKRKLSIHDLRRMTGWKLHCCTPQPVIDVFAFDELVKQAAGKADMYLENDEVTILEFGRILHGLLSADKRQVK
jgi:hypothetical protein